MNSALSVAVNEGVDQLPGGSAKVSLWKTVVNSEARC